MLVCAMTSSALRVRRTVVCRTSILRPQRARCRPVVVSVDSFFLPTTQARFPRATPRAAPRECGTTTTKTLVRGLASPYVFCKNQHSSCEVDTASITSAYLPSSPSRSSAHRHFHLLRLCKGRKTDRLHSRIHTFLRSHRTRPSPFSFRASPTALCP